MLLTSLKILSTSDTSAGLYLTFAAIRLPKLVEKHCRRRSSPSSACARPRGQGLLSTGRSSDREDVAVVHPAIFPSETRMRQGRSMHFYAIMVLGGAALLGCVGCSLTPWARWKNQERLRLEQASEVTQNPLGSMEYAFVGDGPTVLILHGSTGGYDQGRRLGWWIHRLWSSRCATQTAAGGCCFFPQSFTARTSAGSRSGKGYHLI
jgi:hypothetical protein